MIALIVARSKNNVIGKQGQIPWKIKGEQKQFQNLTTDNVVIMGRKTYDEIGHPLPNRTNILITSKPVPKEYPNLLTATSLQEALKLTEDTNIFIIGGYRLFEEAIPLVDKMYITEIDLEIENGDVFFPKFNHDEFIETIEETVNVEIPYKRLTYTRK